MITHVFSDFLYPITHSVEAHCRGTFVRGLNKKGLLDFFFFIVKNIYIFLNFSITCLKIIIIDDNPSMYLKADKILTCVCKLICSLRNTFYWDNDMLKQKKKC